MDYKSVPITSCFTEIPPVFFHAFYDIFENLIEFECFYQKSGVFQFRKILKGMCKMCGERNQIYFLTFSGMIG